MRGEKDLSQTPFKSHNPSYVVLYLTMQRLAKASICKNLNNSS